MPQTGIELLRTLKNRIERGIVPPLLTVVQDLYNFFVQKYFPLHTQFIHALTTSSKDIIIWIMCHNIFYFTVQYIT